MGPRIAHSNLAPFISFTPPPLLQALLRSAVSRFAGGPPISSTLLVRVGLPHARSDCPRAAWMGGGLASARGPAPAHPSSLLPLQAAACAREHRA